MAGSLILPLLAAAALGAQPPSRTVTFADLPPGIARRFNPGSFDSRVDQIERDTDRREREGELDHLIYYVLESQRFTLLPRIEPSRSARQVVEQRSVPLPVRERFEAFLMALARQSSREDPRMRYYAGLLSITQRSPAYLEKEYRRAMRSLWDKEVLRLQHVHETRGHNPDARLEANFTVWSGLSALKGLVPETAIRRVLIVGPGLSAPRAAEIDSHAPQSLQPYAAADALIGLGLARRGQLNIDCADINPRVIDFITAFGTGKRRLDLNAGHGDAGFEQYIRELGAAMGKRTGAVLTVDSDVAERVRAGKLNILTSRWEEQYDLAIATNVLVYFNREELTLAVTNIAAMLRPGGYLLHNEVRPELEGVAAPAGLEKVLTRTVRVAKQTDAFAIYRLK